MVASAATVRPTISLDETLRPSALRDAAAGPIEIRGTVHSQYPCTVTLRVTTGEGLVYQRAVPAHGGGFQLRYPDDFDHALNLKAGVLLIDATTERKFNRRNQAEAMLLMYDSQRHTIPELPTAFTNDLWDARGQAGPACHEWPVVRSLVNAYYRSRGAELAGVSRPDFDLVRAEDLTYYKQNLALFDFDHQARDWSQPLGARVARTFWQSVWDTWFNSSNDHPLDGNPQNQHWTNYQPYAFSNDYADVLIMYLLRQRGVAALDDNLASMCREGTENLLAMQHAMPDNFALPNKRGVREQYTAGAFRYGMFVDGTYLTEGRGWFYNPAFSDYAAGGVLNGRAIWGIGVALREDPHGPLASELKLALRLGVQFCLRDALQAGYAKRSAGNRVYWRDAGEHAYLLLGLLQACAVEPKLPMPASDGTTVTLEALCVTSLEALVDLQQADGAWSIFPNVDSMAVAALADGARLLATRPERERWINAAGRAADVWLTARPPKIEFAGAPVHFGLLLKPGEMTYNWSRVNPAAMKRNAIYFYQTGHWIHALTSLQTVRPEARYRERIDAMARYLCGANPFGIRILNETGGVYNWVEDSDGDGIEDQMRQDMYPESTAYCQIGLIYLMRDLAGVRNP